MIDTGGITTFKKEERMERRRKFDTGEDIVADFLKARHKESGCTDIVPW